MKSMEGSVHRIPLYTIYILFSVYFTCMFYLFDGCIVCKVLYVICRFGRGWRKPCENKSDLSGNCSIHVPRNTDKLEEMKAPCSAKYSV